VTKQALYLKWRPQTFDDVIGQEHVTRTLLNSIQKGRIRHAYLFSGPRGTGKTTTARLLAHALGSQNMDLIEIDAASHTGVDDVRDLRDKVQFMPAEGKYKVYIIDEVHRFSGSAFDALLKTLEEPPEHAIFVLATTEIDKVPDTIKSRCLQFEFRRVALREVTERLQMIAEAEGLNIDRDTLELVARYGTGSVRDSISLLDQIVADPGEHITLALAQKILGTANNEAVEHLAEAALRGDAVAGLRVINEAVDSGSDPRQFGQQLVEHLRYVLLAQTASADLIDASDEMRGVYTRHAEMVEKPVLLRAVRAFNDAVNDQRSGWQPQLSLELALLDSVQGREVAAAPASMGRTAPAAQIPADLDAHIERIVEARLAAMPVGDATSAQRGKVAAAPPPADEPEAQADLKAAGVIPLSAVQGKWSEVVRAAKSRSTILSALLDHVEPQGVNGNVVTLAANNDVFLERVNTSEHRSLLNYILSRLHGETLKVRVVRAGEAVNREAGASGKYNADDPLMKAARDMGAEIKPADDE
jgi:DNA polymerase III subunit gamma/tau